LIILVSRISIVKPEKGKVVEDHLIRMAQAGQLQGKIDEKQLISLLERISDQEKRQETKITVRERITLKRSGKVEEKLT